MPATLLIDREGREIGRLVGPAEWDSEEAKHLIGAALTLAIWRASHHSRWYCAYTLIGKSGLL